MTSSEFSTLLNYIGEIFYIICGVICFMTAARALKNTKSRIGTFIFWAFLGLIFSFGNWVSTGIAPTPEKPIPGFVVGIMLVIMSALSATKQVKMGVFNEVTPEETQKNAQKVGKKIFFPAAAIGVFALILGMIKFSVKGEGGIIVKIALPVAATIGGAAILALVLAMIIAKPKISEVTQGTEKLLMQVGTTGILPQLLTSLGAVFTAAGVGTVISGIMKNIIPDGNFFLGVFFYLVGMAVFTMIMGNAFAAFSVITVGIGFPFVFSYGGNPALLGVLALTGGFCGTLLTPMAANFNIIPVSILGIKDKYKVIKTQMPVALIMFALHIVLMFFLGR